MFPAKQPSKVVVRTRDGKEYSEYMEYPKGDPREPMSMDDLENKFNALSDKLLTADAQAAKKTIIFECEKYSARDFMKSMIV
jgi:2-methylcitrate dehydratase